MIAEYVHDQSLFHVNINAPNKSKEQWAFYDNIQKEIHQFQDLHLESKLIIGGNFNLDNELDCLGGKPKVKDACTKGQHSLWKFNTRLLEDKDYVAKINELHKEWIEECKEIQDPRVLWDYLKHKI